MSRMSSSAVTRSVSRRSGDVMETMTVEMAQMRQDVVSRQLQPCGAFGTAVLLLMAYFLISADK